MLAPRNQSLGASPPKEPASVPVAIRAAFAATIAIAGCGPADARFTTKLASDFAPASHAVSILGVYKDGQMSSESWETLDPRISPALGSASCEAAYAMPLLTSDLTLASAIDDYARANGPTDELLAQMAPASKGDLIVVFTLAGKLPAPKAKDPGASVTGSPVGSSGPGGAGMHRGHRQTFSATADSNELDVSASFYSVPLKRSVGLVAMQYVGVSVEDAVAKFSVELARVLPAARCEGWNWTTRIDAEAVRRSIDP